MSLFSIQFPSPLGLMRAIAGDDGIVFLDFPDRDRFNGEMQRLKGRFNLAGYTVTISPGSHPHLTTLRGELAEYFAGDRREFTVPVAPHGTDFELRTWQFLRTIPFGQTRSYGQQAAALGVPKAARAVGRANGMNFISILVPCHRVIGAAGDLTGYGGGLDRKRWLLERERKGAGPRVEQMRQLSLVLA